MAIIYNLKSGVVRSTKRVLPSLFEGKNRNIRRYRSVGDNHTPQTEDRSICNGEISCPPDKNGTNVFEVSCDDN